MPNPIPRCHAEPLPDHQVAFLFDGEERMRWHFGPNAPRPFLYPLIGPSGRPLTRMGHPGAPDHDHHRGIWFAHNQVVGVDFWSDRTPAVIRQKEWLAYQDSDDETRIAVSLDWLDGHDPRPLLRQELVIGARPGENGETWVELQTTLRPESDSLEFGKSNFGLLAVRVAKRISAHFGGGRLSDSEGRIGEQAIFGQPAAWVDYSGAAPPNAAGVIEEGITYFDHPSNPGHPPSWHVRDDGWMCASTSFHNPVLTTRDAPIRVRYLLHAHAGPVDRDRAVLVGRAFSESPPWTVSKSTAPHTAFTIDRGA